MNKELIEDMRWEAKSKAVGPTNITYAFTPDELEKFAELIVQKCISICEDMDGVDNFVQMMHPRTSRYDCVCEIKEHFGVE